MTSIQTAKKSKGRYVRQIVNLMELLYSLDDYRTFKSYEKLLEERTRKVLTKQEEQMIRAFKFSEEGIRCVEAERKRRDNAYNRRLVALTNRAIMSRRYGIKNGVGMVACSRAKQRTAKLTTIQGNKEECSEAKLVESFNERGSSVADNRAK